MTTTKILTFVVIAAAGLGILATGFNVFTSAIAQTIMDNATMTAVGNMTGGNMTGGNMTGGNITDDSGSISKRKN